jgi:hypothetical protein
MFISRTEQAEVLLHFELEIPKPLHVCLLMHEDWHITMAVWNYDPKKNLKELLLFSLRIPVVH